ncbi:GNAT family N-acetyltransferase [Pseudomonas helleri]|uniref:GNAT family N-acetyltransferase n=1 Tax=Pseudomonas helleri TaxID=1608996 RepID=UPI0021C6B851|nr:GNAT family N-acetyltransferase [Pseudomonas helleri]MCU1755233.1 GNAT family N-acetyltransferase [Pseudomonas helleri]
MTPPQLIRPALASDEAAIRACAEQAYSQYVATIGRKPAPMLADFAAQIAERQVHVCVNGQGDFQGFIVFFSVDQHMFLENVAVSTAGQGKGIGKALVQFCEATALSQGLGSVSLYTNAKMTTNLAIYPRLGYVEVGRRSEAGFDRVYFEKNLLAASQQRG